MAVLSAAGVAGCALWAGKKGALGFAAGAGVSWLSFLMLYRLVKDMESGVSGGAAGVFSILLHSLRYLILGGAIYVIVKLYGVHQPALVTGLMVAVLAATLEAIYEMLYAP